MHGLIVQLSLISLMEVPSDSRHVGNWISIIMELLPTDRWHHVSVVDNPADCASRGLVPAELLQHALWWDHPMGQPGSSSHLLIGQFNHLSLQMIQLKKQEKSPCMWRSPQPHSFLWITIPALPDWNAWLPGYFILWRIAERKVSRIDLSLLSVEELHKSECYWLQLIQRSYFDDEMRVLREQSSLDSSSPLLSLSLLIDFSNLLRVGGRQQLSRSSYELQHPIILHGKHPLTRLIIRTEHLRLMHAGPTLLAASLACRYHILGGRKIVRSVTRVCITCRRNSARPQSQMMGQLPIEWITPCPIFDKDIWQSQFRLC
jgi:hypothetical protein